MSLSEAISCREEIVHRRRMNPGVSDRRALPGTEERGAGGGSGVAVPASGER